MRGSKSSGEVLGEKIRESNKPGKKPASSKVKRQNSADS